MKRFDLKYLIELRKWFHKYPELSLKEHKTSERIIQELKKLGINDSEIKIKAKTGIQIDLKGRGPSIKEPKTICLRADIDGLPIQEINNSISNLQISISLPLRLEIDKNN